MMNKSLLWSAARKHCRLLAVLGGACIGMISVGSLVSEARRFRDEVHLGETEAVLYQMRRYLGPTASLSTSAFHNALEVCYPSTMLENQTKHLTLTVTRATVVFRLVFMDSPEQYQVEPGTLPDSPIDPLFPRKQMARDIYHETLSRDCKAILTSSGFEIGPSATFERAKGTDTPTSFIWTVTPKGEGERELVLDVSDLLLGADAKYKITTETSVNGEKVENPGDGLLVLPITIFTVWSISRRAFDLIRYVIGLVGFVLMYPILHELIKARLHLGASPGPDASGTTDLDRAGVRKPVRGKNARVNCKKRNP